MKLDRRAVPYILLIPALLGAYLLGVYFPVSSGAHPHPTDLHTSEGGYKYVSPLLSCADISNPKPKEVNAAQEAVTQLIEEAKATGKASEVSVYYRDLNDGPWFGLNEDLTFAPASLLKVPLMMSYFRVLEDNPKLAERTTALVRTEGEVRPLIPEADVLADGGSYTPTQLVAAMIMHSDNDAAATIYTLLGERSVNAAFSDLGLEAPTPGVDYQITVRRYASFFRILFNATYLTPENSDQALSLLTKAEFRDGLVAGVPKSVEVAHKFGERALVTGEKQLHDCGIIYAPKQPYMLCVMTQGNDLDSLKRVIAQISRVIYQHVI